MRQLTIKPLIIARLAKLPSRRLVSSSQVSSEPRTVKYWRYGICGLTISTVMLGGITKLTKSGLSMVDWQPFSEFPPKEDDQWTQEFEKYKQFSEFEVRNSDITMQNFKWIWYMEYVHRTFSRLIGLGFFLPAAYFGYKGYFKGRVKYAVAGLGGLILLQGGLDWFTSKRGLKGKHIDNAKPEVSLSGLASQLKHLPEQVPYLLVGGGTASHSAMRAIRGHDPKARVLIITDEDRNPYMRPALSKELWFSEKELRRNLNFKWWNGKERSIFYEIDEFFIPVENLLERENGGVSLIKNVRLISLDPEKKLAHLEGGQSIGYEKCLLAPGGKPKTLPQLESSVPGIKERIMYFRTADDFLRLEKVAETAKTIVVIGGGFLGSELTCALAKSPYRESVPGGQKIIQIYPEAGNLEKILPDYLSKWVSDKVKSEGAQLIPSVELKSVQMNKDKSVRLELSNGDIIDTDYIVCAIGVEPDVQLAKSSNLEIDERTGGYLVNSELEARTDIWVAGDASCFYDIKLGRRRVEHHDHAIHSGRQAGQNMVSTGKAYTHQSMFWSDLGSDISFEAVGIIDSSLSTVAIFAQPEPDKGDTSNQQTPKDQSISDEDSKESEQTRRSIYTDKYGRGVVFYLKDEIIVGILLWNLFSRLTTARRILNEQRKYDDLSEVAKLFNIYLDD